MKRNFKFGCGVAVIIIAVIAGLYFNYKSKTSGDVDKAGEYVVKYLDAKYHRDFVIDSGHYIFNTGGYEFTVYPKDDPDFKFTAWLNSMTESGVSDKYLYFNHRRTAFSWIKPYLDEISKDNYIDSANPGELGKDKLLSAMYNNNLTLPEMLKQFPDQMNIFVRAHINYNITPQNEDEVLKKVYSLLEFLRMKKFGYIEMTLYFYDFPNRSINKIAHETRNFSLDYRFKAPTWIWFNAKNEKRIKKWQDLKNDIIKINNEREVKNATKQQSE